MKSLFTGLVAAVLALSFGGSLLAQQVQLATDPGVQKAVAARNKQLEAVRAGDKRAVEAEAKLKTQASTLAQTVVAQAKVPCTVTEATSRAQWGGNNLVELACQEGIGYVAYVGPNNTNVQAMECIPSQQTPLPTACVLPGNLQPSKGLQPFVSKTGSDCQVTNANGLAASPKLAVYEVACASGAGQMLTIDLPRTPNSRSVTASCLAVSVILPDMKCILTTPEANAAPVRALAAKSDRACPLKDQRFVGFGANDTEYFEFACQDGNGFLLLSNSKGEVQRTISCVQAAQIAGGCKLTDTAAAMANMNGSYSTMLRASGFDCEVAKFAPIIKPNAPAGSPEAIEVSCANRPESVIALVKDGKAEVMNCARSRVDGYGCIYTKAEDANRLLTADLRTTRFQTCEVNGHRAMGASTRNAFIEVSCSDGNPGFVITYPLGSGKPSDATPCGQANSLGGGCQMPANKRS